MPLNHDSGVASPVGLHAAGATSVTGGSAAVADLHSVSVAASTFELDAVPANRGGEIVRKILHMSPGLLAFALPFLEHPDPLDADALRFVSIITVILTLTFLACYRIVRRPGEDNLISTVISYPATIVGTLLLFPEHPEFACVVLIVLAIGDGSAYIIGRSWGTRPLPWNQRKSWAGTLGFVMCSAPLAALAYWLEASPAVSVWVALACGTAAAVAGAAAESLPTKLTDNLRVGVGAAAAVACTYFLLA